MVVQFDKNSKVPRSIAFDDIYYSVDDGVGESLYNFFKGNDLPNAWLDREYFTICELGLGTGLNMVLAIDLFLKESKPNQKLHLISIEKYPLTKEQILQALDRWKDIFSDGLDLFIKRYPLTIPARHSFDLNEKISLTLCFDDVDDALQELNTAVDCWFLDGFNPAKNPDMWSENVFKEIARLSNSEARFATFTAAGFVKRGLEAVGFDVRKEKGFGRKRERLLGRFLGQSVHMPYVCKKNKKVAVIGAGLAGASVAYHLNKNNIHVDVFDKETNIAAKASGNIMGLLNPALTPTQQWKNKFYSAALSYARQEFEHLSLSHDIGYDPCGSIHILHDEKKTKRFEKIIDNSGWPQDLLRIIDASESSELAGVPISYSSVYMKSSAKVSPVKLVAALLSHVDCYLEENIENWHKDECGRYSLLSNTGRSFSGYDSLILASGYGARLMSHLQDLPILKPIRGQVTYINAPDLARKLRLNLCFGGYLTSLDNENMVLGATYDRGDEQDDHRPLDDESNLNFLAQYFPSFVEHMKITGGRAGIRVTTEDYMPYYGRSRIDDGIYYSLAHRSHGVLSSQLIAYKILKQITGS